MLLQLRRFQCALASCFLAVLAALPSAAAFGIVGTIPSEVGQLVAARVAARPCSSSPCRHGGTCTEAAVAPTSAPTQRLACKNIPHFRDAYGTCSAYHSEGWCKGGAQGPNWLAAWGSRATK